MNESEELLDAPEEIIPVPDCLKWTRKLILLKPDQAAELKSLARSSGKRLGPMIREVLNLLIKAGSGGVILAIPERQLTPKLLEWLSKKDEKFQFRL